MKLLDDWKDILKRAWSVRLALLAAVLTGAATILPSMGDVANPYFLLVAAVLTNVGTVVVRLLQQKKRPGGAR